jgi:FemAB-related protein (PEP-CTERM system-associated)
MLLELPRSKEELLKSFKAKLRSQISRPQKEGMTTIIGKAELIDSFYKVFSINMRDLGSPVHSKKLLKEICDILNYNVRIGIVNYENTPVAAGLIFCFRDTVEIPWASSLKQYNKLSPNMLLYWSLMEYACDNGFTYFDFGRSTPEEGTYKFKEQWGAKPWPLYWQNIVFNGHPVSQNDLKKSDFGRASHYWKKLPVPISNMIGPLIRKHISL